MENYYTKCTLMGPYSGVKGKREVGVKSGRDF